MTYAEKTVFISYRRNVSSYIARAIFLDLRAHGYDVFMDVESIDSGTFDTIILNQIAARGHFLVILTPGTVERCAEPDDWLRREIEYAIEKQRNIVPVLVNNFDFTGTEEYLTGKLSELLRYNGLSLYHDYFDPAMEKLRSRFLKQPVSGEIVPAPAPDHGFINAKIQEVARQPVPTQVELSAEDYYSRGCAKEQENDIDGAIADLAEAIRLNPQFPQAFAKRGVLRSSKGFYDDAIADLTRAIFFNPQIADAYKQRGHARRKTGNYEAAIADYKKAASLLPNHPEVYNSMGITRYLNKDYEGADLEFRHAESVLDPRTRTDKSLLFTRQLKKVTPFSQNVAEITFHSCVMLAGLAITYDARGEVDDATRLWRSLVAHDERYNDADWVGKKFDWEQPIIDAVRRLIDKL